MVFARDGKSIDSRDVDSNLLFIVQTGNEKMNNKGQALIEFLMNYGWAILVILIAIGALAYFGVFGNLQAKCDVAMGADSHHFKNIEVCKTLFNNSAVAYQQDKKFAQYEFEAMTCDELKQEMLIEWTNRRDDMFGMDRDLFVLKGCLK